MLNVNVSHKLKNKGVAVNMPVYEYSCGDCGKKVEMLVRSFEEEGLYCPFCKGTSLVRVMSSFAYHRSEGDRLAGLDTSTRSSEDYYKDDRNVGLWAKKRMKEMGKCDFEPSFEERVNPR
ncbi:MAG: regulatory protein [Desulfotomaculum sp. 46_296]|nr:MAG: regulatory protein [Desulfotomaculum sp. 46_296]